MNFLHLKYAIMVAETGSISKAAEKLYVAQPNVSRAIKELESDLNITIFERNSKGMIVTPEGEQLIHYAKRILRQIDDMEKIFKYQKERRQSGETWGKICFWSVVNRKNGCHIQGFYRGSGYGFPEAG